MSILTNKSVNRFANNAGVKKFVNKLCTPANLLPIVLLEGSVMLGRTYQAQKRGGDIEAKERFTEEVTAAVVWLWGIKVINKALDFVIDKIGKVKKNTGVKDFEFDTGSDYVRQPFEHVTTGLSKSKKKMISALKFSKIVASALIGVGIMGIILPKVNQKITEKRLEKRQNNPKTQPVAQIKMESTEKPKTESKENSNQKFQGGSFIELAAHRMENDNITQLLTQDTGLFTGRAINARNKHERVEILFRDIASSFFYVASTPLIYMMLCKMDSLKGKNTNIAPSRVDDLHNKMMGIFASGQKDMSKEDFARKMLGSRQVSDDVFKKAEGIFDKTKNIASLSDMNKFIDTNIADESKKSVFKKKAADLSMLQPKTSGQEILTKSQLTNLFHDGILNEPEFINKLINDSTGGAAMKPIKFVSQKSVDKARTTANNYVESILEQAQKDKTDKISVNLLEKMKTRNLITKFGYWGMGMAVSAYFLSTGIPKMQYWITQKRTGKKDFPGIWEYQNKQNIKNT